jgi:hypothetical protein
MGPVFDRPDDKLRDTHQEAIPIKLRFKEMMDLAGLNPSRGQLYQRHCERSEAIHSFFLLQDGLLRRGACHRARIRATRWLLAVTVSKPS